MTVPPPLVGGWVGLWVDGWIDGWTDELFVIVIYVHMRNKMVSLAKSHTWMKYKTLDVLNI